MNLIRSLVLIHYHNTFDAIFFREKIMTKLEFIDKRDANGLLLFNSAYKLSHDFVDNCMKIIVEYDIYRNLTYHYDEEYIEFYYRKLFFYAFLPIANQLVINNWDNESNDFPVCADIDISSFPSFDLLNIVAPASTNHRYTGIMKTKLLFQLRNIFKCIKYIKHSLELSIGSFLSFSTNLKNISLKKKHGKKISAEIVEGANLNNRSSIFWLQDDNINPSDVLVYFNLKGKKSLQLIEKLDSHNVSWVNLRYWKNKQKAPSNLEILKSSKSLKSSDPVYKWLFSEASKLIINVEYWYSFFDKFNVAIHQDQTERGQEVILKQIALCKLNSLSFSSQRSYLDNITGRFYTYYPTDVFFSWGEDTTKRIIKKVINKDNPSFKGVISTGCYMLDQYVINQYKDIEYIKKRFDSFGVNHTILFLDTNHALCNDYLSQVTKTRDMEALYKGLLNLLINTPDIGLIIKPKKQIFLNSLNINEILKKALDTNRLHIVNDADGIKPAVYANISDIIVGVATHDIPAALVECVLLKKPGILYNYGGLQSVESEFFSWAYNTVIFDSVDDVVSSLIKFNSSEIPNLIGDWSSHLLEFDPFLDFKAVNRIGFYLSLLLKYSLEGLDKNLNVSMANAEYSKYFGEDKVA